MVTVMNALYGDDSWKSIPGGLTAAQSKAALVKLYCDKLEALGPERPQCPPFGSYAELPDLVSASGST